MEQAFKLPEYLSLQGNPSENWRRWIQRFELYLVAKEKTKKPDPTKISMLLSAVGPEALERYNHFEWREGEDKNKFDHVKAKFEKEFAGQKRIVFSRYQFWDSSRTAGQTFDEFLTHLRTLALSCEFAEPENMIRDKIVFSTDNPTLKERLLREPQLDLQKAVDISRSSELAHKEFVSMKGADKSDYKEVDALNTTRPSKGRTPKSGKQGGSRGRNSQNRDKGRNCRRCGTTHARNECPAWGKTCLRCGGPNHFSSQCRSVNPNVNEMVTQDSSEDEFFVDSLYVGNISTQDNSAWFSVVNVNGSKVKMKLDTGASTNVISWKTFKKLQNRPPLQASNVILRAYGDHVIDHKGKATLTCKTNHCEEPLQFYVAMTKAPPILGLQACEKLGLIQRTDCLPSQPMRGQPSVNVINPGHLTKQDVLEEYKDVFMGLGKFEPYHIAIENGAEPVIHPPRRVSHGLHDRLKEKLDQMERDEIIAKVDKPTNWVNSLVIVEKKDGSLRLCLDPKDLNKVIRREHFQIPTFEDVVSRLGGKKYFTVLDQKDSYWQVPLSEESSYVCTFNTPFGRYRFLRMPFGICSASEVLQKRVYKVFGDMQGVEVIADDMIIAGATEEEHDQLLRNVMQRAREQNVKFNPKKFQFKQQRAVYFGTIISEDGIRPDPGKVKAMVELPQPTSKEDVRRLMGTVASFKDFIPDMSTTMGPIRQLLKKDVEFQWLPEHQQAVDKIKQVLSSEPVLRFFDPNKKVTIQADASSTGLGACLLQDRGPVAYASRALSETEQRWFQIEKELLAVTFAAEHFHHYIYGREV